MDTNEQKNLFSAGVNINIPTITWVYLALAIFVPAFFIIVTKKFLKK